MKRIRRIIAPILQSNSIYPLRAVAAAVYGVLIVGGLALLFLTVHSTRSLHILLLVSLILLGSVFEEIRVFVRLRLKWQKQRRSAANLCQKCGYDLRASADRCPECGTKATSSNVKMEGPDDPLEIKVQLVISRVLMAAGPTIGLGLCLGKELGLVYVGWIPVLFLCHLAAAFERFVGASRACMAQVSATPIVSGNSRAISIPLVGTRAAGVMLLE